MSYDICSWLCSFVAEAERSFSFALPTPVPCVSLSVLCACDFAVRVSSVATSTAGASNSSAQASPFRKRHLPSRQDCANVRSVSTGWESERGRAAAATQPRDDATTTSSWWEPGSPLLRPIVKEGVLKKRGGRINAWGDRCVIGVRLDGLDALLPV